MSRHIPFTLYTGFLVLTGRREQAYWYAVRYWLKQVRRTQHALFCPWCVKRSRYGNPALPPAQGLLCEDCQRENAPIIRRLTFTAEHRSQYYHEH